MELRRPIRLLALASFTMAVFAGSNAMGAYAVQIGTFKNPNTDFVSAARSIADVSAQLNRKGHTVYQMGPFDSYTAANEMLLRAKELGYDDAFVNQTTRADSERSAPVSGAAPGLRNAAMSQPSSRAQTGGIPTSMLNSLSAEERKRVVYLDGVLHIKEGAKFTRLDQYQH